jgi:protein phosphatase
VQVGDSRAYLLRDQSFQQVARDHRWVTEQVAAGALTADQAKTHPRRNVLTRAVGTGPAVEADLGVVELREGDHLLLCSDGLHGLVSDEEMAKVIAEQEPQQACQTLVDRANEGGGHDNSTVVVAGIESIEASPDLVGADRFQTTTLPLGTALAHRRGLGTTLSLVITAPLWVPFWMLGKALRVPFRRRGR